MNVRQKAKDLIELVADEKTADGERYSAAVNACALIRKYDLLSSPFDVVSDNQTVRAAKDIFDTLQDPRLKDGLKTLADGFARLRKR